MDYTQGRNMSEAIMIKLTKKGVDRQEAHESLRKLAIQSEIEKRPFKEILLEDEFVSSLLNENQIDDALDPNNYLGTTFEQIEKFLKI